MFNFKFYNWLVGLMKKMILTFSLQNPYINEVLSKTSIVMSAQQERLSPSAFFRRFNLPFPPKRAIWVISRLRRFLYNCQLFGAFGIAKKELIHSQIPNLLRIFIMSLLGKIQNRGIYEDHSLSKETNTFILKLFNKSLPPFLGYWLASFGLWQVHYWIQH